MKTSPRHAAPPDLSIVVPAYNEQKRIGRTLDKLAEYLAHDACFRKKRVEVVVVVATSSDKTLSIVRSKQPKFNNLILVEPGAHAGKGRDVRAGMLKARGRLRMFMDADLATPLHHIQEFYEACAGGSDLVIGTRNLHRHHPNIIRRSMSNIGNALFKAVSGLWIEDSQCGFKIFTAASTKLCFNKMTILGWGFDVEVLTIAKVNGLKIEPIRINDWEDKPYSKFTDSLLIVVLRSMRDLCVILSKRLRGSYQGTL